MEVDLASLLAMEPPVSSGYGAPSKGSGGGGGYSSGGGGGGGGYGGGSSVSSGYGAPSKGEAAVDMALASLLEEARSMDIPQQGQRSPWRWLQQRRRRRQRWIWRWI